MHASKPLLVGRVAALCAAVAACRSGAPPVGSVERAAQCLYVDEGPGADGTVPIRVETVVTGLEVPWGIAFLPGGDMLVTERPGRVRLVRGGQLVPEPVARVPAAADGEGGLMGIALHPDFAANRFFFVYYTARRGDGTVNRLARYRLAPDNASAEAERVLLDGVPAAQNHDGGRLRIGPDGMLYVGTGDAGEPDRSQDPRSLAGKVLRLTPEGQIPADNPTPGSARFLSGVRNVEAFDWLDRDTLVLADHGPSGERLLRGHDEVSVVRAGDNLGWPTIWGCRAHGRLVSAALSWSEAVPPGGAAIYTGTAIPEWRGDLLVGTLGSRHLHRVAFDPQRPGRVLRHEVYLRGEAPSGHGRLREVVMGPDGHLYMTTSNCDGRGTCPPDRDRVLRITR
ncbi:MAG: PQQ-dependent sugar dehydrogenase [Deltaproteobacteria bacterium]|nr:PQQ-dependent sugar dehydrogenase [Myxococcales bacterium]MDP3214317.1 PQQ-dependent sugar dehydrogenase [Deltaproteobacteria bacterium]